MAKSTLGSFSNLVQKNLQIRGTPRSKIEDWFGEHSVATIVAFLFIFTMLCFTIIILFKCNLSQNIITLFSTILGTLGGFFAGSKIKK